jgi:type VI secretion system protein ImpK
MSDPGFDQDATLYIPTGGRGGATPRPAQPQFPQTAAVMTVDFDSLAGINRLVAAANPILCSIPPLREMLTHPDPGGLRQCQLEQIANFEKRARELGISPESVMVARYALCTFVDEAIAGTPWGGTADWARNSLLVTLHKEAGGGEKFFQLLNRMAEDPGHNIELLEFFYVCLALGFEGRFRVIEGGRSQLDGLRERVAELIKRQRGEHERDLSKQWRGEVTNNAKFSSMLPFWVSVAAVGVVLAGVFVFFLFLLSADSDKIAFANVNPPKPVQRVVVQQKAVPPRLAGFLADEIAKGLVAVRDDANESLVTIRGDGLFDSGSADLRSEYEAIILRVTDALNQVQGDIMVIGHTDNIPSRSIQFPSNWHLSKGRAASVSNLIKTRLTGKRTLLSEGRGETEPIAPNDTPANRALNRRVEILLKVAP